MLSQQVTVVVGGVELIDSKLVISKGTKYALIGKNGVGKTSLLKRVSEMVPSSILCEQEPLVSSLTPVQVVLNADAKVAALIKEENDPNTTDERLAEIYEEMTDFNTDAAESKVKAILHGLGFSTAMMNSGSETLSGGFRIRMSLAKALFMNPPLLLLDEPSNHLDLNASIWLTAYLSNLKSTMIIVSHNITLIDDVCQSIIQLENTKLSYFRGNYSLYAAMKNQQTRKEVVKKKHIKFDNFDDVPSGPLISVNDVSFGYKTGPVLLDNVNFGIFKETKIALVGSNGAGKTTLLKLLNGTELPTDGHIDINRKIAIATFNQHYVDDLEQSVCSCQYIANRHNIHQQLAREALGKFGLCGKTHTIPISQLSGGQKARVAFADLFCQRPDVLLLDEPTNNLDLESIESLLLGLKTYNSAIVMVSHDARLINDMECDLYIVADKNVEKFDGSFDDYKLSVLKSHTI